MQDVGALDVPEEEVLVVPVVKTLKKSNFDLSFEGVIVKYKDTSMICCMMEAFGYWLKGQDREAHEVEHEVERVHPEVDRLLVSHNLSQLGDVLVFELPLDWKSLKYC